MNQFLSLLLRKQSAQTKKHSEAEKDNNHMGQIGIANLHVGHHGFGKRKKQKKRGQDSSFGGYLKGFQKIKIGHQQKPVKNKVCNGADGMPVRKNTEERRHYQMGVQKTEFRGIIPVRRGKNMPGLREKLGKHHFCRHIGIQPVVLKEQVDKKQQSESKEQKNMWVIFFEAFRH